MASLPFLVLIMLSSFAAIIPITEAAVANITMFFDAACKSPGETILPLLSQSDNCTSIGSTSRYVGIEANFLAQGCIRKCLTPAVCKAV
jgi:hypothetical protein